MTPQFKRAVETYGPRFMADLGLSGSNAGTVPSGLDFPVSFPADYPMVASSYPAQRSALAKSIGLGRAGALVEAAPPAKAPSRKQAT